MKFSFNGEPMQGELHSFEYSNDILNGVIIDTDDHYAFLSDNVENHRNFIEHIPDTENFYHYDLTDVEIDFDEAPHSWVVKSIASLIIKTAEAVLYQAGEE